MYYPTAIRIAEVVFIVALFFAVFGAISLARHALALTMAAVGLFGYVSASQVFHAPSNAPHHDAVTHSVKIAALANGTSTTSTTTTGFLVSTTSTNQTPIYQYVQRNTDGSYSITTIDASTPVKEDATPATARIDTTRCIYDSADTRKHWGTYCDDGGTTMIHVPKGSIVRNFTIDAAKR